jgi:hypothetical protein
LIFWLGRVFDDVGIAMFGSMFLEEWYTLATPLGNALEPGAGASKEGLECEIDDLVLDE